jgi:hypothetical protein
MLVPELSDGDGWILRSDSLLYLVRCACHTAKSGEGPTRLSVCIRSKTMWEDPWHLMACSMTCLWP